MLDFIATAVFFGLFSSWALDAFMQGDRGFAFILALLSGYFLLAGLAASYALRRTAINHHPLE